MSFLGTLASSFKGGGDGRVPLSRGFVSPWALALGTNHGFGRGFEYAEAVRQGYLANPIAQRAVRIVAEGIAGAPLASGGKRRSKQRRRASVRLDSKSSGWPSRAAWYIPANSAGSYSEQRGQPGVHTATSCRRWRSSQRSRPWSRSSPLSSGPYQSSAAPAAERRPGASITSVITPAASRACLRRSRRSRQLSSLSQAGRFLGRGGSPPPKQRGLSHGSCPSSGALHA